MKQLDKNQKTLLTIGISATIVILFAAFFVYPQTADILELNNKIYKEKTRQEELRIEEKDIKQAKDKEKEVDLILNQLSVHLTTKEDILNFIIQLEDIAKQTNNIQTIKIIEDTNNPQVKKTENEEKPTNTNASTVQSQNPADSKTNDFVEVEVKLQGTFSNLINYLTELKKAEILTDEESLDSQLSELSALPANQPIAVNQNEPQTSDIATTLMLKVYIKNTNAPK